MYLGEIFFLMEGDEDDHWKTLDDTGYYGKQAAGTIPFARDTKRFLISHRSRYVEQPGEWGTWGGAIDEGENPREAALRELEEESGYSGPITMIPLYVYRHSGLGRDGKPFKFRYSNFLAVVDHEFTPPPYQPYPHPGWETQGFRWCEFGKWPRPLHFGLVAVLNDAASKATIQRVLAETT